MTYLPLTNKNAPTLSPVLGKFEKFQAFHITGTCLDPRVVATRRVPRAFRATIPTNLFIWEKVFEYLEPRDICKLVVTAKGWSRFLNLKPLMCQYFRLNGPGQYNAFKKIISEISVDEKIPPLFIELSSWYNDSHFYHKRELETCLKSRETLDYQIFYGLLNVFYSTWCQLVEAHRQELLAKVRYVEWNDKREMSQRSFRNILIALRDVPELDFSHSQATSDFKSSLQLEKASLPRLKKLKMFESMLPLHLASLLRAAPHLKKLDLKAHRAVDCAHLSDLADASCPNLATIALKWVAIDNEGLMAIIKAAPHLRKIDLLGCQELKEGLFDSLQQNAFLFLEKIILTRTNITKSDFLALIERVPNVRRIDLVSCKKLMGRMKRFHKMESLDSLEFINLEYSAIHGRVVRSLLEAAPHLKIIDMRGCEEIKGGAFKRLKPNSLFELEKIILAGTGIQPSDLEAILRAAPNMKRLEIGYCRKLEGGVLSHLKAQEMSVLESLDLSDLQLAKNDFRSLIHFMPHVKELKISEYRGSVRSLFEGLEENALASLERIDLGRTDFNIADLEILARVAPHLKKIDLFDCLNFAQKQILPASQFQLASLEEIRLILTNATFAEVKYVLRVARNIQKIALKCDSDISYRISNEELGRIPRHIRIRG